MTHRARSLAPAILLLFAALACGAEAPPAAAATGPVQPAELAALLAQPNAPLLLDVRTAEEYAQGHIAGATHVPVQELAARIEELAPYRGRGVITYCESGKRASQASELLRSAGFTGVRLLDGSMKRWREEGREVANP